MRYELAKLKVRLDTTMVYVTHDQAEAMTLADKIVVMREGVIEQEGSPTEVYMSPVNIFVAKFIGSGEMNILDVSFIRHRGKLSVFRLHTGEDVSLMRRENVEYSTESRYFLGIRPEDIEVLQPNTLFFGNKIDAVVSLAENLGGEGYVHAALSDGSVVTLKSKKNVSEVPGDNVKLAYAIEKCYLFDENGRTIFGQAGLVGDNCVACIDGESTEGTVSRDFPE
jgi:ABC-type sugar transport system ATPase subunit